MVKRMVGILASVVLVLAGLALQSTSVAAAAPISSPPGKYYMSLGDSLGYGYQQAKAISDTQATGIANASSFTTGFADDFARMLAAIDPGIQVVNFSCPGETTVSFMSGCVSAQKGQITLHSGYSGSQLAAALSFLGAHPGQVSPITVALGNNDLLSLADSCGLQNLACVAQGLPAAAGHMLANLGAILAALRQAAPTAEIVVFQLYNPLAAAVPATNAFVGPINTAIAGVASSVGAYTANPYPAFNVAQPQPQTLCSVTAVCGPLHDIHPTDAGYLTMSQLLWQASGYAKLAHGFFVTWVSTAPGIGRVYFGTGTKCVGLVGVATRDLQPAGGTTHIVYVTGNDLPGTVGDVGIVPGVTYFYETATLSASGEQIDNNGGACYSASLPTS